MRRWEWVEPFAARTAKNLAQREGIWNLCVSATLRDTFPFIPDLGVSLTRFLGSMQKLIPVLSWEECVVPIG